MTDVDDRRPTEPRPERSGRETGGPRWIGVPRGASGAWRRGRVLAGATGLLALLLAVPALVPNALGHAGSLFETGLPWLGLAVPVTAVAAALRRSASAGLAVLLLAAVWAGSFGRLYLPSGSDVEPNLTVVTHNIGAADGDPGATVRRVLAADPDLVALQEVTWEKSASYDRALGSELEHSERWGTVGLWSRYPITDARSLDLGLGWNRAIRAEVDGPGGGIAVYVVHLASVRMGGTGFDTELRDRGIVELADEVAREPLDRVVVMGDLNGSTDDRAMTPLTSRLAAVRGAGGDGVGPTWPAGFPLVRIDHVLVRGVTPTETWALPRTDSDHLPIAARLRV
ncbi:endonuclease/exonuclease/phosphatase family protein [Nocardiopsis sp. FIRDI 009]|uniref:endonuclease/exonuclease/phosphatase family protein n=1 Tax=Nocardiopsis sp. FIRDI 009 TaxID=714197 RepID=UPI000E22B819|nr:endonuclease/exonuclease/phosphatase family protein [Nocardiopsis sp. FIRDI 009]